MYPNITDHATSCKVSRVQRLTRIFQRIWLRPESQMSYLTADGDEAVLSPFMPFHLVRLYVPDQPGRATLVPRLYTVSKIQRNPAGELSEFAVDVIVHDHMARFGVTGLTENPQDILTQNPMMAVGGFMDGLVEESLPPNVISDDDVEPGPGSDWAAKAQVGDKVLAQLRHVEGELVSYAPESAKALLLLADPAGLPAVEQIVQAEQEANRKRPVLVFCLLPHKADRRILEGAEVFWVLPGDDLWEIVSREMAAQLAELPDEESWYVWAALESKECTRAEEFFRAGLGWSLEHVDLHEFWVA